MAQCLTQKQALGNCLFVVERQGVVNKAWLKSTSYIIDTPGNTFLGLKDLISQAKSEGKIAVYYQKEDKAYCYLANYGS